FKEHVKIKVAAAQRSLALIRQLANTEKGLSAPGMRQLYQSCVVSVADYGSEVWWKGQTHLANKLQLLQNSATRSILGAFRTSPTTALDAEAGLLPANLRLNYNQTRLATRILKLPSTHPLVKWLPDSVPRDGARVPEEVIAGCPWDRLENRTAKYGTSLIRILARLHRWVGRNTTLEQQEESPPMSTPRSLTFTISETPKDRVTLKHKALLCTINLQTSIVAYTDGAIVEIK